MNGKGFFILTILQYFLISVLLILIVIYTRTIFNNQKKLEKLQKDRFISEFKIIAEKYYDWEINVLEDIANYIYTYCKENKIKVDDILVLILTESKYKPYAKSNKGAFGLMQIKYSTAKILQNKVELPLSLKDPYINVVYGLEHLNNLHKIYNSPIEVYSAYNTGSNHLKNKGINWNFIRKLLINKTYIENKILFRKLDTSF